jgi:chitinase
LSLTGQLIKDAMELAKKKDMKTLMLVHNLIQKQGFDGVNIDLEVTLKCTATRSSLGATAVYSPSIALRSG